MKKLTTEDFIARAQDIHGTTYGYDLAQYEGMQERATIVCPVHGEFRQTPDRHLAGNGCKGCGIARRALERRRTAASEFERKAREVHGDVFDYGLVEYERARSKVRIRCLVHDHVFEQTPNHHLNGSGCPLCAGNVRLSKSDFRDRARIVHGDRFDYDRVEYLSTHTKVVIGCPVHGAFEQTPANHLQGQGCPDCGRLSATRSQTHDQLEVVTRFRETFGDRYGYGFVEYSGMHEKVRIVCPDHGVFL